MDPPTAWVTAREWLAEHEVTAPLAIQWVHVPSRQGVAGEPVLIRVPVTRATLLLKWRAKQRGKSSPAFRDPKTQRVRKILHQLRSIILPEPVPAHEIRDWLLGLGRFAGRKRIAETLAQEISGGKIRLLDILVVIPRPKTGKTASALREYFAERIVPRLLEGRRVWSAERVATKAMARAFARELRELMRREPPSPKSRPAAPRKRRTSRSSSPRRSRGSRTSSSRRRSRR